MRSMGAWLVRLRDALQPHQRDREFDAEVAFHLHQQIREHVEAGMPPDEARRRALVEFGGLPQLRELYRDQRRWPLLSDVVRESRFAARRLRRSPAFLALAVVSLALGIGANTVIFSAMRAVVLQPLPFVSPETLVAVEMAPPSDPTSTTPLPVPLYELVRDQVQGLEAVGSYDRLWSVNLGAEGDALAERLNGHRASPALLHAFGAQPVVGRLYTDAESTVGAPPTVVLAFDVWQRRFGADPAVVGRSILLDGVSTTVVGVVADGFSVLDEYVDFWMPFRLSQANRQGPAHWIYTVGRLAEGASIEAVTESAQGALNAYRQQYPNRAEGWTMRLRPIADYFVGPLRTPLYVLQGAVALVLVIACANLASLLLARAPGRRREFAVRTALGEPRHGLVRQLLIESLMLSALGGLAGVAIAALALPALVSLTPAWFVRIETVQLDWVVLAFAAGATLLTAIAFGLLPALESSRGDVVRGLRPSGTRSTGTRARAWYLNGLVAAQVAFAFVLLVSAGLLVRSLAGMTRADLGADPDGVLSLQVRLPLSEYTSEVQVPSGLPTRDYSPRIPLFYEQSLDALRQVAGVVSAGGLSLPPFTAAGQDLLVAVDSGHGMESDPVRVGQYWVTDGYFETMRVPVMAGRTITAADAANAPWVVVISESLQRRLWPDGGAVGRFVRFTPHPSYGEPPREVVGVVADTKVQLTEPSPVPLIYVPHRQQLARHGAGQAPWRTRMTFLLRTRGEPTALAPAARQAVGRVDPNQPVFDMRPVASYVHDQTRSTRYFVALLAGFAAIALVLGLVGVYGVTAHSVSLRTREFGIRRALGAQVGHVLRLAVGRSAAIVGVGLVVGLGAAAGVTRFLESLLWSVGATDSGTFAVTALLLMLAGLVACIVPAWRATRVAPADILRSE